MRMKGEIVRLPDASSASLISLLSSCPNIQISNIQGGLLSYSRRVFLLLNVSSWMCSPLNICSRVSHLMFAFFEKPY